jgi:hypothetical protein
MILSENWIIIPPNDEFQNKNIILEAMTSKTQE